MHDLVDAVESLTYLRERAQRLPWYRVAARREARELARRWEARVTRTVLWERGVPMRTRFTAGMVGWGPRLGRVRGGHARRACPGEALARRPGGPCRDDRGRSACSDHSGAFAALLGANPVRGFR